MTRNFEIVWSGVAQELGRKTIACADLDIAVVTAWKELPAIARAARLPCATITVRDAAIGQGVIEDVINDPPEENVWIMPLLLLVGGFAMLVAFIWFLRHGYVDAWKGRRNPFMYLFMLFPMGVFGSIFSVVFSLEARRKAAEQWKQDFGNIAPPSTPRHPRSHRIVIAHHALWRIIPLILLLSAGGAACLWFALAGRYHHATGWQLWELALALVGVTLVMVAAGMLRQLVRDRGALLWIEAGEIIRGNRMVDSILDVRSVTLGTYVPPKGPSYEALLLRPREGDDIPLVTQGLREGGEAVEARLNQLLRLPPPPERAT